MVETWRIVLAMFNQKLASRDMLWLLCSEASEQFRWMLVFADWASTAMRWIVATDWFRVCRAARIFSFAAAAVAIEKPARWSKNSFWSLGAIVVRELWLWPFLKEKQAGRKDKRKRVFILELELLNWLLMVITKIIYSGLFI
jgi:hypothetical protein